MLVANIETGKSTKLVDKYKKLSLYRPKKIKLYFMGTGIGLS